MDVTEIVIQGIAPHDSIELKGLRAFNILVGANNSGKSFALEAIAKLIDYKVNTHKTRHKRFFAERKTSYNIKWTFNTSVAEIFGSIEQAKEFLQRLKPGISKTVLEHGLTRTIRVMADTHSESLRRNQSVPILVKDRALFDNSNFKSGYMSDGISNRINRYFVDYFDALTKVDEKLQFEVSPRVVHKRSTSQNMPIREHKRSNSVTLS